MEKNVEDDVAEVVSNAGRFEVHSAGAQVTAWDSPEAGELLFVSEKTDSGVGVSVRGGIPLCFPWFGDPSVWDDQVPLLGGQFASAKHGFARKVNWQQVDSVIDEDGTWTVTYELTERDLADQGYVDVQPFLAALRIAFDSTSLELAFAVANTGDEAFRYEAAFHTYFEVGDIGKTLVVGLEGLDYFDKAGGGVIEVQRGPLSFTGEVDRVFQSPNAVELVDQARDLRTRISKEGSGTTVVWNPGPDVATTIADLGDDEWRKFVCVETANAGASAIVLEPGQSHTMRARYEVGTLGI